MEKYNIEKAIVLPINAREEYGMPADEVNKWLGNIVSQNPNKFIAFADIQPEGANFIELSPYYLEKAVKECGLKGLKLHPTNLQMDIDDLQFDALNQMDFTDEEIEKIAYKNILELLNQSI